LPTPLVTEELACLSATPEGLQRQLGCTAELMRTQIRHWLTEEEDASFDGTLLYRYIGPDGLIMTLDSWRLRLNTWQAMVDPRERKEWRTSDVIDGALRAMPPYTQAELEADFDRLLRRGARMSSLTDDRPPEPVDAAPWLSQRGWARSAMWDRYAARHTGACLVFTRDDLLPQVEAANPLTSGAIRSWGRICYVDAPISLTVSADIASSEHLREVLDDTTTQRGVARDLYGTKLSDWASEREFRIIDILWDLPPTTLDDPLYVPIGESLKAIILGEEYPTTTARDLLHGLPRGLDSPEVLRCTWERGVPFLELI
jgi:hypothetical protein